MDASKAVREVVQAALTVAREEAQKQEAALGRKLTNAEAMALAELVERQLKTALVMLKLK